MQEKKETANILTITLTNRYLDAIVLVSQSDEELQGIIGELRRGIHSRSRRVKKITFSVSI